MSSGGDGKTTTKHPLQNGKKTKGKVKIKMEYIDDKVKRYTTFSKRKTGLMKKAYELSTLTGTQVMMLVASETGHVYTFATSKLKPIITSEAGKALIQTCLRSPDRPVTAAAGEEACDMSSDGRDLSGPLWGSGQGTPADEGTDDSCASTSDPRHLQITETRACDSPVSWSEDPAAASPPDPLVTTAFAVNQSDLCVASAGTGTGSTSLAVLRPALVQHWPSDPLPHSLPHPAVGVVKAEPQPDTGQGGTIVGSKMEIAAAEVEVDTEPTDLSRPRHLLSL